MNALIRVLGIVLGTALVIVLWYEASPLIIWVLDFNLWVIKQVGSIIPAPYGAMAESALRVGLGADKALLLAEGSWIAGGLIRFVMGPSHK